jgi:hypothetical protein
MRSSLSTAYENPSFIRRVTTVGSLFNAVHDTSKPVEHHFHLMKSYRAELKAMGHDINDILFKDIVLCSLDDSYTDVKNMILMSEDEPDLTTIEALVTDACVAVTPDAIKLEPQKIALAVRNGKQSSWKDISLSVRNDKSSWATGREHHHSDGRLSDRFVDKNDYRQWYSIYENDCYRCGRTGHHANQCILPMLDDVKDSSIKHKKEQNNYLTTFQVGGPSQHPSSSHHFFTAVVHESDSTNWGHSGNDADGEDDRRGIVKNRGELISVFVVADR